MPKLSNIKLYLSLVAFVSLSIFGTMEAYGQESTEEVAAKTEEASTDTEQAAEEKSDLLSGIVAYNEIFKVEIDLPAEMEQFRERMDDTRTTSIVVMFNEDATLSQVANERPVEEPKAAPNDRRNRRWKVYQPKNKHITFVDLNTEETTLQREFFDRTFLVEGGEKLKWKLKDEMSEFLGYTCMRAEAMIDSSLVEAWFTPEIPIPAGPDNFYGLPGLILVLTTDNGNHSYVATDVSLRTIDSELMVAPTEGKKMKQKDFDKMVEEKTAEMEAQMKQWRSRMGRGRRGRR